MSKAVIDQIKAKVATIKEALIEDVGAKDDSNTRAVIDASFDLVSIFLESQVRIADAAERSKKG